MPRSGGHDHPEPLHFLPHEVGTHIITFYLPACDYSGDLQIRGEGRGANGEWSGMDLCKVLIKRPNQDGPRRSNLLSQECNIFSPLGISLESFA
jgi:hypothetical protein